MPAAGGSDAWYVFEPIGPRPKKAPVAVIMHGYFEFSGYSQMAALIRHTVRKGTIVIYPRWQTDIATPCPGPIDIEPCIASAVNGIKGALSYLRSSPRHVQPRLRKASYFGFSFGGIITANLANRWKSLELPKPRAIFLDDPHDGALTGTDEPALDDDLGGHTRLDAVPVPRARQRSHRRDRRQGNRRTEAATRSSRSSTSIPAKNKDLVLTHTDTTAIRP